MIFLIILSLSMAFASEQTIKCGPGKLRLNSHGKVTEEKSVYCYNQDKTELYSKDFQLEKLKKIKIYESESANPGFALCTALKGEPQFVEFKAEDQWYKLDRCLFTDDTYIDTGLLYLRTR